ncbi:MAG: cupin domain-containing protein [Solirubrobacterales bacterium]|nr:cupin domain-containing protein [Solirubrobacterales bacterium]
MSSNTTAPAFWTQDTLWHVLVSSEQTGGAMTVLEQLMPKGGGPPSHVHDRLLECFFILEGAINYQVGDAIVIGKKRNAVTIPPGTTHAFNLRSEVARVLNMFTSGGFDEWITMLAVPAQAQALPPRLGS